MAPKLLDQVREIIEVKHMSRRTAEAYTYWIKRFILSHHKRHPSGLGTAEISAFLSHLAVEQRVAASTQNQALNALVFLYKYVLRQEPGDFSCFIRARRPKRLPVVLSREEVRRILGRLARIIHKLSATAAEPSVPSALCSLVGRRAHAMRPYTSLLHEYDFDALESSGQEGNGPFSSRGNGPDAG